MYYVIITLYVWVLLILWWFLSLFWVFFIVLKMFFLWQKCMDLFYLMIGNKDRLHPTLLKFSCYKSALKTHDTFKCNRCAPKHVISWSRCTSKTHFEGASTLQCLKNYHCKVHFGSCFNVFSNVKHWAKTQNLEMMLKLIYFSMSKLKVLYFQPFWTPLFKIGHKKHIFGYVMTLKFFKLLLHTIRNYKVHHIFHVFQAFYS